MASTTSFSRIISGADAEKRQKRTGGEKAIMVGIHFLRKLTVFLVKIIRSIYRGRRGKGKRRRELIDSHGVCSCNQQEEQRSDAWAR